MTVLIKTLIKMESFFPTVGAFLFDSFFGANKRNVPAEVCLSFREFVAFGRNTLAQTFA